MGPQICNVKISEIEMLYQNTIKLETTGMTTLESKTAIKKINDNFKLITG